MPKAKSHKGLLKRIRVTASGKVKHKRSGASHLMSGTPGDQKRRMRRPKYVPTSVARKLETSLGRRLTGRNADDPTESTK
jgi:large subunit ribosomal protein L35